MFKCHLVSLESCISGCGIQKRALNGELKFTISGMKTGYAMKVDELFPGTLTEFHHKTA